MNKRWWLLVTLALVVLAGGVMAAPQPDESKEGKARLTDKFKDLAPAKDKDEGPVKSAPVTAPKGEDQEVEVTTPTGNLGVGMAAKFMYGWSEKGKDTMWPGRDEFNTTLVVLKLRGMLTDNIDYHLELAASWNPEINIGGLSGWSSPGEIQGSAVGVRQASIVFHDLIPWTRVEIGTFIPPLTNYMARSVNNLDLIMYPLLNNGKMMDPWPWGVAPWKTGNRPIARDFSPWQQTGMNLTFQTPYMLKIDIGCWNGMMNTRTNNTNANDDIATATSVVLTFQPDPHLSLAAAYWGEQFDLTYPMIDNGSLIPTPTWTQEASRKMNVWYLYAAYLTDTLEVTADYAQGTIPKYLLQYRGTPLSGGPGYSNTFYDLRWEAWQLTVGYWFRPNLELLTRYEQLDPNTIGTQKIPGSAYDKQTWFTMGLNYRLFERAEISLNYIIKREQGNNVSRGDGGKDPSLLPYNPKYGVQDNDLLLLQFQIWQ
jgi:hypothetical protein